MPIETLPRGYSLGTQTGRVRVLHVPSTISHSVYMLCIMYRVWYACIRPGYEMVLLRWHRGKKMVFRIIYLNYTSSTRERYETLDVCYYTIAYEMHMRCCAAA